VGRGSLNADIVFVGEAPRQKEDETGIPFVGPVGKRFDQIVQKIGVENFYVTNIVKCVPERKNEKPTLEQIVKCGRWLNIQLNKIRPNIIVAMGGYAKDRLLDLPGAMKKYAGQGFVSEIYQVVFVMYHPATLLYHYDKYWPIFEDHIDKLKKLIFSLDIENSNYWNQIRPDEGLKRIWQKKQVKMKF